MCDREVIATALHEAQSAMTMIMLSPTFLVSFNILSCLKELLEELEPPLLSSCGPPHPQCPCSREQ